LIRPNIRHYLDAVNAKWQIDVPLVQMFFDVAQSRVAFQDVATGCRPPA
jgi:hypothetical protein